MNSTSVDVLPLYYETIPPSSSSSSSSLPFSPTLSEKLDYQYHDIPNKRRQSAPSITGRTRTSSREPRVLIAGGSFGGLLLALLLERIQIPYYLFEGGTKVQRLAALGLGPSILPVFEQLAITSLLASISLPCPTVEIFSHKLKKLGAIGMQTQTERTGYENLFCSRATLYELLLAQLNSANVIAGKDILWYEENELGVDLYCSDNSIYSGDILVGADGVHSCVRKTLHKTLAKKNLLSKSDKEPMKPEYVLVTGKTNRQSAERYQCLKDPYVHFCSVVGQNGRGWNVLNLPDDQICWALWVQLDSATAAQIEVTEASESGTDNTESIVQWFRDTPCPYGGTMGDLVDASAKELRAKEYIEEKLFNTWYHGRTVLIGDACHSMLPWSGQCITPEIHDAVILANSIFELKDLSQNSITNAFKEYQQQQYPRAKAQFANSRNATKLLCGQSFKERLSRYAILNWAPQSCFQRAMEESTMYRPQASFMPHAENRGTGPVCPQKPGKQWTEAEVASRVASVWNNNRKNE